MNDAGNLRTFFKNIWPGPQDKDLLIAELRRQVDAQQAYINELKRAEWVAKSFDAEHDRDRWRKIADDLYKQLVVSFCWHCGHEATRCIDADRVAESYREAVCSE